MFRLMDILIMMGGLSLFASGACAVQNPTTPEKARTLVLKYAAGSQYSDLVSLSKKGKIKFAYAKNKTKTPASKIKSGDALKQAIGATPYPGILGEVKSLEIKKKVSKKNKTSYTLKFKHGSGKYGITFFFKTKKGYLYLKKIKIWDEK